MHFIQSSYFWLWPLVLSFFALETMVRLFVRSAISLHSLLGGSIQVRAIVLKHR